MPLENVMKKKLAIVVLCAAALAVAGGCGKDSDNISSDTVTEGASSDTAAAEEIEYDVEDYVELGDYKGVEVSIENTYDVTDDDVKEEIESQVLSYPVYNVLEKDTVEDGDLVNIDYEGKIDGEAFDGGTAQGSYLEIGSGSFIDGFEDGLIGVKVGETVDLNVTFPEDYGSDELNGKDAVFTVTVNSIEEKIDMTFDTLTDEYVSENFGNETVDDYVASVRESLEQTAEESKESAIQNAVIAAVRENSTINGLPDGLLDQRVEEYIGQFETMCEAYGVTLADYLSNYYQMTEDEFREEVESYMQEQIEMEFVLEAVAKAENLTVDEEGFQEYVDNIVLNNGFESEDALYEQYGEDYVRNAYINYNLSLNFLVDNAKVTLTEPEEADTATEGDASAAE